MFLNHIRLKNRKKFFYGQIGLEFIAHHDRLVGCTLSRVAPVERKSIFTIFSCFKRKTFKKGPFQILSWRPKTYIFVRSGINGLIIYKNPIQDPYEKEQENYYSNLRLNLNVINKLMLNQGGVSSDGGNQTEEEMEVLGKY